MPNQRPPLLVFTGDASLVAQVDAALGAAMALVVHEPADLKRVLARIDPDTAAVVADARSVESPATTFAALISANRRAPTLKCVMVCRLAAAQSEQLTQPVTTDVPAVLVLDCEPIADLICTHLGDPSNTMAAARAHRRLQPRLPQGLHAFLAAAFNIGPTKATIEGIAAHFSTSRKSLAELHRNERWPRPEVVLDLVIALYAAELYVGAGWRIKRISAHLEYGAQTDFRALVRRVFRVAPSSIRSGDSACSVDPLLDAWTTVHLALHRQRERELLTKRIGVSIAALE